MNIRIEPYESYRSQHQDSEFTDWLRAVAGSTWAEATEHRFTQDIARGTLPESVFRNYLIQEYAFVETSATATGYTVAKAPSMSQKAHLAKALLGLTTDQEDFFQHAFERMGIEQEEWKLSTLPSSVEAFKDFVIRTAATGTYEELLTNMLGAEWMYLTWCQVASQHAPKHPVIREWIDLHVTANFEEGVVWMREQLDQIGPHLMPERQEKLAKLFRRMLELEIEFHHAPYNAYFDSWVNTTQDFHTE